MVKTKRVAFQVEGDKEIQEIQEDGILISILSSLNMRDAVRTSMLSSRWRYLWTYIPNLYFDGGNMFAKKSMDIPKLDSEKEESCLEKKHDNFVGCVNEFLQHHRGVGVEKFYVAFSLHKKHADHLDRWTSFAIASGAKDLTLNLRNVSRTTEFYEFPCQLFAGGKGGSVKRVCLHSCSLRVPPNFDGFNSLKVLYLKEVHVNDSDVQDLLSSSPSLESLSVIRSYELVNLKISHSSGKLKYVNIERCLCLREIEFFAVNLSFFEYNGHRVSLRCRNAPRLTRASIQVNELGGAVDYYFTGLPHDMPHLESLFFMVDQNYEVGDLPVNFNKFTHLKHLVLSVWATFPGNLLWMSSFLSATPFLEKFELHQWYSRRSHKKKKHINRPFKCPHNHLKTVEISGFTGSISEIEMTIYLLNNAIALESMTISTRKKVYHGNDNWKSYRGYRPITRTKLAPFNNLQVPPQGTSPGCQNKDMILSGGCHC